MRRTLSAAHTCDSKKRRNYYRSERSYGTFQRSVPLPATVDSGKADAVFRNGVLTVTLPKTEAAERRTRIAVKPR